MQKDQKARTKTGRKANERHTDRQKGLTKVLYDQKARTKTGKKAKEIETDRQKDKKGHLKVHAVGSEGENKDRQDTIGKAVGQTKKKTFGQARCRSEKRLHSKQRRLEVDSEQGKITTCSYCTMMSTEQERLYRASKVVAEQ